MRIGTQAQLAKELGCKPPHINRLVKAKDYRIIMIGKKIDLDKTIDNLLKSGFGKKTGKSTKKAPIEDLKKMSEKMFGGLVKAVVDVEREIMVVDADLHADEESLLLEDGSHQENLWGINIYPKHYGDENFIAFDSMINLRPSQGNRSRGISDPKVRERIQHIVNKLIEK